MAKYCFINHAHPAVAELLDDPVMPERLADQLNRLQNTDRQISFSYAQFGFAPRDREIAKVEAIELVTCVQIEFLALVGGKSIEFA